MMIFQKAIPRRAFLRGAGATLALPLLDGMAPAFGATPSKPTTRLSFVYVPNGVIMDKWTPGREGGGFDLTPVLAPLEAFRDRLVIVSGLDSNEARNRPGEAAGEHPRASSAYLTGVHTLEKHKEGSVVRAGTSVDQIAARELGRHTELASLELGIESGEVGSVCDTGYSCAYYNTISWRTPTTPMPMVNNPRTVFERLFGDSSSTSPRERLARIQENRSILDFVSQDLARLLRVVGPDDRAKVDQYVEAIRDIERRIEKAEAQSAREMPTMNRPSGIPERFEDHYKLLVDLQVLAYQTDLTRVTTFMIGREMSTQTYPELGFTEPYHPVTHHQGDPVKIAKALQINIYHAQMFSYYLEKMRSTSDGDGSLFDHTAVIYGSGMSDGNIHLPSNLPILLTGGASGRIRSARHIRYPENTPVANLWLTLLDMADVRIDRLGDSTGRLNPLPI